MSDLPAPLALEAKLVVLGAQGGGKTSLVHRFVKNGFVGEPQPTVGASFVTTRIHDADSGATIRVQIWDTAGQERYRSISKLYYRGADAAIFCYDVTNEKSFLDMERWLKELKGHCDAETIVHFVGTKIDIVAQDPAKREVSFEQCMAFAAKQTIENEMASSSRDNTDGDAGSRIIARTNSAPATTTKTTSSTRSSIFWGQEHMWNCHEASAKDGEGIDEIFRLIARQIISQLMKRQDAQLQEDDGSKPVSRAREQGTLESKGQAQGYFDQPGSRGRSACRAGADGDKRRSWLGFMTPGSEALGQVDITAIDGLQKKRCC